jgi:hypothetical protein
MARKTPPKGGFLDGMVRVKRKGKPRWRSPDGDSLFEWDSLHGEIEWYNKRGRHRGSLDAITGEVIKPEVRGRRIDV